MKKSSTSKRLIKAAAKKILVGILTGSPNDLPTVVKVLEYLERAHKEGVHVLIGCAGMAAHLAGYQPHRGMFHKIY